MSKKTNRNNIEKKYSNIIKYNVTTYENAKRIIKEIQSLNIDYLKLLTYLFTNFDNIPSDLSKSQRSSWKSKAYNLGKKRAKEVLTKFSDKDTLLKSTIYTSLILKKDTDKELEAISRKLKEENTILDVKLYKFLMPQYPNYEEAKKIINQVKLLGLYKSSEFWEISTIIQGYETRNKQRKKWISLTKDVYDTSVKENVPKADRKEPNKGQAKNISKVDKNREQTPGLTVDNALLFGSIKPLKKSVNITTTQRSQLLVKKLKTIYNDTCQICGKRLKINDNEYYSEVHHIKPLGVHNGPDIIENTIVLCPNHHILFDKGAITINLMNRTVVHFDPNDEINNKKITIKHNIEQRYIEYHNKNIFIGYSKNNHSTNKQYETRVFKRPERVPGKVFYGDVVTIIDINTNEKFQVKLEDYYNRSLMSDIQKTLLNYSIGDIFKYKSNSYKIILAEPSE